MALNKDEQNRLRELMKEAVTMLCKTRLRFDTKFSVEGLLGITVDEKEVTLINIKEDVFREDPNDTCEVYQLTPLKDEEVDGREEDSTTSCCENEALVLHTDETTRSVPGSVGIVRRKTRDRKRKPSKTPLEHSFSEFDNNSDSERTTANGDFEEAKMSPNSEKKGFFSPTVDQIIQEYEQQKYTDPTSLMYMAKRSRRKYPAHLTELHTQGLLPILPSKASSLVSILPKTRSEAAHKVIISRTSEDGAPTIVIKKEPGEDDCEDALGSLKSIQPIMIEPQSEERSAAKSRLRGDPSSTSGGETSRTYESPAHWVEESILRQEGCFVSTRVMLRRHASLRGETVVNIMNAMSHPRTDPSYIGEFKQQGRIQVFYKCPPLLLDPSALEPYKITLDEYTNYFFANPKPPNGTPSQWLTYVNTVLEGVPYNPHLFPVEALDLIGEDLNKLNTKRLILEQRFADSGQGEFVLGSFKSGDDSS